MKKSTLTPFLFTIIPPNLIQLLKNEILFEIPIEPSEMRSKAMIRQQQKHTKHFSVGFQFFCVKRSFEKKIMNGEEKTHKSAQVGFLEE
jgi:hypothetical protein